MLRVREHAERTDTGRQRRMNEDSVFARPPLFVVADGMGGAQAGEVASRTAVEVFGEGLPDGPGSVEERLAQLVSEANARVHDLAQAHEEHAGMGTTLTAAYVGEDDVAVAHVGDSRLYCLRDGRLEQRTDDHSLVGEMVRRGQLSPEEAEEHPQRSIITRALGIEGDIAIDHHSWPAHDGDVFLLCSDGLTSMVTDARVEEILREASSLDEATRRLVEAANEAGGRDNITVVLFRIEEVGGAAGDQPTGTHEAVAASAPGPASGEASAAGPATATAAAAPATAPATVAEPPRPRAPRAPRPPSAAAPPPRRRRWAGPLKAGLVLALVAGVLGSAAWIASRSVYFVDTGDDGFVTLYQGLPYELPAGLELYSKQFESGVSVQSLPPRVRRSVTSQELRSHEDAVDLIRQLERGELVGQR